VSAERPCKQGLSFGAPCGKQSDRRPKVGALARAVRVFRTTYDDTQLLAAIHLAQAAV